jgi:hypothetical protein
MSAPHRPNSAPYRTGNHLLSSSDPPLFARGKIRPAGHPDNDL